ncbi:sulfite exporter TauE/SafE family protein [Kingella negevensis]|uniref:Probable membrane transporter protein n=1 Tax=Kingella negevensis TaxID=1522312 RepID=A0A238HH65_9NEIS|nr:sulfite exporter TauE/SafE family protein [Kingella negevensis]MDK4679585.1 sulfite exporter TauE/SafE family protein [Kingella negevensis]MDK4682697.1 sulfite exporter TauE/SafE family protein [Kingella negevensis]MDK4685260.1 sulfite exporter TauE/SafE family protein [Kingella negevensis]MDK4689025.1 sulfite exporter TauE/SafE family protein [Kingella negevensis]MDK4690894.1 sulfite exporter TauE/SafE family protein [Kingella negevensis]
MNDMLFGLILAGFFAGLMDAAVGGGGLLQIPALFGLLPNSTPIASVLGVNKFASFSGTAMAATQFARKVSLPWKMLLPAAVVAFAASYIGAKLAASVPVQYMKPAMLVIMLLMFVYTFVKKDLGQAVRDTALTQREYYLGIACGAAIGLYDGILGPGTGSLLAFIFVRFFAYDFLTATASAKIINLTTNLAALSFFIPNGHIVWVWAIPLAVANFSGGFVGSWLAVRGGTKFLRVGFMCLLAVLIGKFGWDTYS